MAVYGIHPGARKALAQAAYDAKHAMDYGVVKDGLWHKVSLEEAQRMYRTAASKILREAMVEVNPDRLLGIECQNCKRVEMMKGDVKTFICPCTPQETQWVVKCRRIDF